MTGVIPTYFLVGVAAATGVAAFFLEKSPRDHSMTSRASAYELPTSRVTVDERSDLIARMKKTMAAQDTVKEDPRPKRDKLMSMNESAWLLEDLNLAEVAYDYHLISIGPNERDKNRITIFIPTSNNFTIYQQITLDQAREYLKKKEKK